MPSANFPEKLNRQHAALYALLHLAYDKFDVPHKGIIHIGAHMAEELELYRAFGIKRMLWVEANPKLKTALKKRLAHHKGSKCLFFAASNEESETDFCFTPQAPMCSSLLTPTNISARPLQQQILSVQQKRLDDALATAEHSLYNLMVLDIQGAELQALHGCTDILPNIDAVITEFSWYDIYENGCTLNELDAFLKTHGLTRLETYSDTWGIAGDALHIKQSIINVYQPKRGRKRLSYYSASN